MLGALWKEGIHEVCIEDVHGIHVPGNGQQTVVDGSHNGQ